jgi:hypothetical protein
LVVEVGPWVFYQTLIGNMDTTLVAGVQTTTYAGLALNINSGVVAAALVEFDESVLLGQ